MIDQQGLTKRQAKEILRQLSKALYQIKTEEQKSSCFLCKVADKVFTLIASNHILNEEKIAPGKEIYIYCTDDDYNKHLKTIRIDKNRTIYTVGNFNGENIDVTIIEIWPEKDGFNEEDFIEIDEDLMSDNIIFNYIDRNVYFLYYKGGEECSFSTGIIMEKGEKAYTLLHTCSSGMGSAGGPIVLYNNKVIGVHRGRNVVKNINVATLLQFPIREFLKKLNKI